MDHRRAIHVGCLFGGILGVALTGLAAAQEPVPYNALQAGQDAYQAAEAERRAAIDRQRSLIEQMKWYNTWAYRGYAPTLIDIYAYRYAPYGYSYSPRRAYRQAIRYGYSPVFQPWPRVPGDIYGYPYYGAARQPAGHEKTYTSPNGYVYRPLYENPPPPQPPPGPPPQPQPRIDGSPESIPAPPSEPGPKEF